MNDIAEAVANIGRERNSANASLISSFDGNPEEAAEAIRLGKDTGVAPVLVNNDLENFKRQQKVQLTSTLVDNNPYLRDFVANDPMAPKVAHDDIGNLDRLTSGLAKTLALGPVFAPIVAATRVARKINQGPLPWERGFVTTFMKENPELVGEFLEGASHGTPELMKQGILAGAQSLKDLGKMSPEEYKRQQESLWEIGGPLDALTWVLETAGSAAGSAAIPMITGGIGAAAGIPGGPGGVLVGGAIGAGSASYVMNFGEVYKALKDAGVDPVIAQQYAAAAAMPMAALDVTGVGVIANRFVKAAAKKEFIDTLVKRVAKEVGIAAGAEAATEGIQEIIKDAAVSIATDKAFLTTEHAKGWLEAALAGGIGGATFGTATAIAGAGAKARPYINEGKEPPAGIDPTLDKIKGDQAKTDMKVLDQHLKDARQTALRDRSPEMVARLLQAQLGDRSIEVSSEAISQLYGENPVTAEDGLLGWVPDLETQMRAEYPGGGYVSIPLKDWLARIDPEVEKLLHDHILARPTGVTLTEGKTAAAFDVYHGTPHFFDVFDLKYMGTGEGAQVRGAGMYFGQAKGTGLQYKAQTSRDVRITTDTVGGSLDEGEIARKIVPDEARTDVRYPLQLALGRMKNTGVSLEEAIKIMHEEYPHYPPESVAEAERLLREANPKVSGEGHLLKTRIHAELEQFLDLDKPLSEQTPAIQAIIEKNWGTREEWGQEWFTVTGDMLRKRLEGINVPAKQVSKEFAEAGIPGSKFLDQFSRDKAELIARHQRNIELMEKAIARPELEGDQLLAVEESLAESRAVVAEAGELTYNIVLFDTSLAQIIERNGEAIASTREAAGLGVLTDLGPQAEWLLTQNRLRMQAIMDRLNQAKTPEQIAALRQEVKEVQQTLRAAGKEAIRRVQPGWTGTPATKRTNITFGKQALNVQPIFTDNLSTVLDEAEISPVVPFGMYLEPVFNSIKQLAANVPVHVISDKDFQTIVENAEAAPGTAAFYSWHKTPGLDHIVIPESQFYGKNAAKHVLHEAIHAATAHALDNNPALLKAIDNFMLALKQTNPELETLYGFSDAFEFVAETMSNRDFQEALAAIELDERMAQVLGLAEWKGKTLWQGIVEFIRRALAIPEGSFSALEGALRLTELATEKQAEVLVRREGRTVAAREKQLELHGVTRQEDLKIFEEARLVGLTVDQYIKVMQHIAERNAEDTAYLLKRIEKLVRKRQTKEWKENQVRIKAEVTDALENRPDIALMNFFRTGRLYGEQYGMPKMNSELLTPEQRKLIPDRWQSSRGTDPMDFANLVGYTSVEQMALRAAILNEQMIAAKQPSLKKYVDSLVKFETERRMMKEYGDLETNIIREAQEHVVSPTQMDLLHEDTVAMGMANGWEMPFTKAEVIKGVKATFGKLNAVKVSMEKFLRDAGKAGKLSGIASEIDKNPTEFFKQRQNQEYALRKAGEAKVLERELESFDKTAERLGRRQPTTVAPEYHAHIQALLTAAELPVKNSPEEIFRTLNFYKITTLDSLMLQAKANGIDLDLFLPDTYVPKKFEAMTVDEFREFKEAIEGLEAAGREQRKITVGDARRNHEDVRAEVLDNLTQMPIRSIEETETGGKWLYGWDAASTRMEEIVKDLDLRKELGPLYNILIRPFESAKAHWFTMIEELSKTLKGMRGGNKAWRRTMNDEIPQDFIYDNYSNTYFNLTRWNLIKMMLNWGNESNRGKLARGIASAELGRIATGEETQATYDKIDALIDKHANKEDWEFVQNIWNIFAGWVDKQEEVIRNTHGKVPKWIEATPISNRHGDFEGGYIPLISDTSRLIPQQRELPQVDADALMGPNFYRATTARPHHLERTGAVYFVDITNSLENLAGRMQQHVHDMAFREFVVNAGKIIYDKEIMAAIKKHYGVEYANQMEPWLKRVANEFTIPEKELQWYNSILRYFRLNLTVAALPLNYAVMYSPAVGTMNIKQLLKYSNETRADREKILAHSEELKHILYNLDRDLTDQLQHVVGGRGAWAKWTAFQRRAVEIMYKPLVAMEQQTRSVTFYGEFMHQKAQGLADGDAASLADSKVRERHGAVSQGDLPAVMANRNEFVKTATIFMGYFSMIRNWARQLPGQARRGEFGEMAKTVWGTFLVAALFNAALFTRRKENDTIWSFLARAIVDTPMSMVPYIREWWSFETESRRPTNPVFNFYMATHNLIKDGVDALKGKEVKHPVRHTLNFMGQAVGVPGTLQVGRTGEFAYDVMTGKQRPRDVTEWIRGLHTGESKLRK